MEVRSKVIKGIIILGIIVISVISLVLDFTNGKEIALIGIGGLIGLTKGD